MTRIKCVAVSVRKLHWKRKSPSSREAHGVSCIYVARKVSPQTWMLSIHDPMLGTTHTFPLPILEEAKRWCEQHNDQLALRGIVVHRKPPKP